MSRVSLLSKNSSWNNEIPAKDISVEKALTDAGLNYTVEKIRNQYEFNGQVFDGHDFQVVRSDNGQPVACVGNKFNPIQNVEMFSDIHQVAAVNNATLAGAGTFCGGEYSFVQYRLEQHITVQGREGDISELYLLAFNSFSGSKLSFLTLFANRLFCMNQSRALQYNNHQLTGTGFYHKIRHCSTKLQRIAQANAAFSEAVAGAVAIAEFNSALESKSMDKQGMADFTRQLLPAQDESDVSTQLQNRREAITALFSRGEGNLGRSHFDAFNAVTEYFNHEVTAKNTAGRNATENRLVSLLPDGTADKVITRAAQLLLAA